MSGDEYPIYGVSGGEYPRDRVSGGEYPIYGVSGGEHPRERVSGGEYPLDNIFTLSSSVSLCLFENIFFGLYMP